MKSLTYQGVEYQFPFSDSFRRHTKAELADMSESAKEHGIMNNVLLYIDEKHGENCVLDGEGRMTAAIEADVKIPFKNLGAMTIDVAYSKALACNDHRRHDTPKSIKLRKKMVAAARKQGKSIRQIAEDFNMTKSTVSNDVSQLSNSGQLKPPAKIKGLDGRTRKMPTSTKCDKCTRLKIKVKGCAQCAALKAEKKSKKPVPDVELAEVAENLPAPSVGKLETYYRNDGIPDMPGVYRPRMTKSSAGQETVLDGYGNPIPPAVGDTFADPKLRDILAQSISGAEIIDSVYKRFIELKAGRKPFQQYPWLDIPEVKKLADAVRDNAVKLCDELRAGIPFAVCPDCSGSKKDCKSCKLSGYWPKFECDVYPKRFRKAVE